MKTLACQAAWRFCFACRVLPEWTGTAVRCRTVRASTAAPDAVTEPQSRHHDDEDVVRLDSVSVTSDEARGLWLPAVAVHILHAHLDGKGGSAAE